MKIRSKISLYFAPFVLLTLFSFFALHYYLVRKTLIDSAQTELAKLEQNIHRSAQALLSTAINNYLRGITEKNSNLIYGQYVKFQEGILSEEQAKRNVQQLFNLQPVGESGYLVAVEEKNEKLYLDLHPFLPRSDCTHTEGCQEWAKTRNGYTEYDWKNPLDNSYRKKAAYVQEFSPWHWIVGASSYLDEFVNLINVEDLRRLISPIRINRSGYFFVFDENNTILIHPEIKNVGGSELINSKGESVLQLLKESESGYLTYLWKNPLEEEERLKYAFIDKLEGYNWYLVASGYLSEVYEPILYFKKITFGMVIIAGGALFFIIFRLSRIISTPLFELRSAINKFYEKKKAFNWHPHPIEEINILGNAFSRMTTELNRSMTDLEGKNLELAASQQLNEESRFYLDSIINSMPSVIIGVDLDMCVTQWNSKAFAATGLSWDDVEGHKLFDVYEILQPYRDILEESLAVNELRTISHKSTDPDGNVSHSEITIYPLVNSGNEGAVIRIDDITDRVDMEQRLRQSQKMDAIGQLAGGIAHDFNNMLSGILGAAELLYVKVRPDEKSLVKIITEASWRAGELIQKLLAFSRKESIAFVPVDFHTVIKDTIEILNRTLDKKITIKSHLKADLTIVNGDWSQLQSSLLNIGINSGHAMIDGGTLTFTTSNISFEEGVFIQDFIHLAKGEYLMVEVRDTGSGIPKEHLKHIFEPFYTTKKHNAGTGLGLAAVYGAIKQHNAAIAVYSEIDKGTFFTLYFPLSDAREPEAEKQESLMYGEGCILIIDDEPIVRATARMILEKLGYVTLEAENGHSGVEMFKRHKDTIDLIILDMLMPVMDGIECFYALKKVDKHARVIISSGFTRDADLVALHKDGLIAFVRKPYNMKELSRVVAVAMEKTIINIE